MHYIDIAVGYIACGFLVTSFEVELFNKEIRQV